MRKIILSIALMLMVLSVSSQTVITKDFNDYQETNLNGQDNWVAKAHSAGGGYMVIDYLGDGLPTTPDETLGVFFNNANTNYGEVATHKSTPDFQFDFSGGGTIEVEIDMYYDWWGSVFGVGYDADGDGVVLPPMKYEPTVPNANLPSKDGGIYFTTSGKASTDPKFKNGIVLADNTMPVEFDYDASVGWTRWKIMIDLEANDKAGSVTLFADHGCTGEFQPIPEIQGLNAGLTPGSGDCKDPAMWDGIFFLNSSKAAYDNLLVRHIPPGLSLQFIDFPAIPDQFIYADPIQLQATATSGLPVSFELLEGPATLDGNILTLTGETGMIKIKASQEGDGVEWQAAPSVSRTFEVIDPDLYTPGITVRRPYDNTNVYLPNFKPIILNVSLQIEHANAIKFEEVKCTIDDEDVILNTDYPNDPDNGYFYAYWTPSRYGEHTMTTTVTTSGGKITTATTTFNVTNEYADVDVTAFDGDLICTPSIHSDRGEYVFPTHVGAFNEITAYYDHNCVNGSCDSYDRTGGVKIRDYRGNWMELYRYITPFGKQCEDNLDVTDYTTVLQGLVEFELYFESWAGEGYNPTLSFNMIKGTPDYLYADVKEIWFDTYAFGDYANLQPVPKVDYYFGEQTLAAKLKLITTGHNWTSLGHGGNAYNTGNAAEFYKGTHFIHLDNAKVYDQELWRTCAPNPAGCQPQSGTWSTARSGWCPGSIAMVWDYDLKDYIANGEVNIFYEFDPTYADLCHPNHPDCVSGQGGCPDCDQAPDNPILRVSGKVVTFGNEVAVFDGEISLEELPSYEVDFYPNPAQTTLNFTTDYEQGRLSVMILNANGQEMKRFTFSGSKSIDVSDLTSGVYIVKILGNTLETRKLVIK